MHDYRVKGHLSHPQKLLKMGALLSLFQASGRAWALPFLQGASHRSCSIYCPCPHKTVGTSGSQRVGPGRAASVPPGNWWKCKFLGPIPDLLDQKLHSVVTGSSGEYDVCKVVGTIIWNTLTTSLGPICK